MKAMHLIKRFVVEEQGTETVEWAIMAGLIAVGAIALIGGIGIWVQDQFQALHDGLSADPDTVGG